ncbi:CLUMA_CG018305, isoform A [Clunio marinus]|uniref:CLUMA_CG018305, isoform A n=1 Tax=Clunio marinus TaxID=568069 RepID=A0A1J1J0U5_9DIPT|nr:CLUMA_CG018305, isoform A [Clunio marinus]
MSYLLCINTGENDTNESKLPTKASEVPLEKAPEYATMADAINISKASQDLLKLTKLLQR